MRHITGKTFLSVTFLILVSCGGGGGGGGGITFRSSTTPIVLHFGDAPVDRVLAFAMTVNSMAVVDPVAGGNLQILSSPTTIEFRHLNGTWQPARMAGAGIPFGIYKQAIFTVAPTATMTVLDATTGLPVKSTVTVSPTVINVGMSYRSEPTNGSVYIAAVHFDMPRSLTLNANTATVSPFFFSFGLEPVLPVGQQVLSLGRVEDLEAVVKGASSTSLTLTSPQVSGAFTVTAGPSTVLAGGITTLSDLQPNNIVEISGDTQQDASILAARVEAIVAPSTSGMEAAGVVVSTMGSPVSAFQLVTQSSAAPGTTKPELGDTLTVNCASATFSADTDEVDLSGLSLPAFSASTMTKAQRVQVSTASSNATSVAATTVKLQRQGITGILQTWSGTGSGGIAARGTLTLPSDSSFALLTGQTSLALYQQPSTQLFGGISVGDTLEPYGLLLYDSASNTYSLVASSIMHPL